MLSLVCHAYLLNLRYAREETSMWCLCRLLWHYSYSTDHYPSTAMSRYLQHVLQQRNTMIVQAPANVFTETTKNNSTFCLVACWSGTRFNLDAGTLNKCLKYSELDFELRPKKGLALATKTLASISRPTAFWHEYVAKNGPYIDCASYLEILLSIGIAHPNWLLRWCILVYAETKCPFSIWIECIWYTSSEICISIAAQHAV